MSAPLIEARGIYKRLRAPRASADIHSNIQVGAAKLSPAPSGFYVPSDSGFPTGLGRTLPVSFGPGDPPEPHRPDERVSVRHPIVCTKVIEIAIHEWCA